MISNPGDQLNYFGENYMITVFVACILEKETFEHYKQNDGQTIEHKGFVSGSLIFETEPGKIFGTKLFTTIEGNMCDINKRSMIDSFNGVEKMRNYFSLIPNIYGITRYIIHNARCGVKLNNKPLYLGVEKENFLPEEKKSLKNIVFIGTLIRRKKIEEVFRLANIFPNLIIFSKFITKVVSTKPIRFPSSDVT